MDKNTTKCIAAETSQSKTKGNIGGRKPKLKKRDNRYVVRLTDDENARFLALFDASGLHTKAEYIAAVLLNRELKTIKIDKAGQDFYMRLTTFHSQFRIVGANYNQIVKALKTNFTEKKALAFLYKLEKETIKLVELSRKIAELTEEFKEKYG